MVIRQGKLRVDGVSVVQDRLICSDKGLTLEMSDSNLFTVVNLIYLNYKLSTLLINQT